jgi:hypothetical protein
MHSRDGERNRTIRAGMDSAMNSASAFFSHRRSEERDSTGVSPWSFTHAPESHGCEPVMNGFRCRVPLHGRAES